MKILILNIYKIINDKFNSLKNIKINIILVYLKIKIHNIREIKDNFLYDIEGTCRFSRSAKNDIRNDDDSLIGSAVNDLAIGIFGADRSVPSFGSFAANDCASRNNDFDVLSDFARVSRRAQTRNTDVTCVANSVISRLIDVARGGVLNYAPERSPPRARCEAQDELNFSCHRPDRASGGRKKERSRAVIRQWALSQTKALALLSDFTTRGA